MRALIQRVHWAEVTVDGETVGRIEKGLLVYVGVGVDDSPADVEWLARKIIGLRVFTDEDGKQNLSGQDGRGGVLVVSNFTLMGDGRKGRRPSYEAAARPDEARVLTDQLAAALRSGGVAAVAEGVFGAHMAVTSQADGPVNLILDSP